MSKRMAEGSAKMALEFNNIEEENSSEVTPIALGVYYPPNKLSRCYRRTQTRQRNDRAVLKSGEFNVDQPNPNHKFRFFSNWFITMVESRWRWTLLNFFIAFTADWMFFAFIYWIIAYLHDDLSENHLPQKQNITERIPCIKNIYGFTSTFLFSIEVHTTLAYGKRAITLECPSAIFAMCIQCILSSIFQAFMVGILFAKLTRPKARTQTILFSRNAVINIRDETFCMIFRVGDMRKSRILNIKASVYILKLLTDDERLADSEQIELEVEVDGCESMFFLWPVSVVHVINEKSPLYKLSAADLLSGKLEILVIFEGTIESTGQPVQARSSFTENEILWGHRFNPLVIYDKQKNLYDVDFSKLSETEQVDTPLCSACEYMSLVSNIDIIEK